MHPTSWLPRGGWAVLALLCALLHASPETRAETVPDLAPVMPQPAANPAPQPPGQPPPIATSRPSFTDAATTVPQGSLQLESGATYTNDRDGAHTWTFPESLARLGIGQTCLDFRGFSLGQGLAQLPDPGTFQVQGLTLPHALSVRCLNNHLIGRNLGMIGTGQDCIQTQAVAAVPIEQMQGNSLKPGWNGSHFVYPSAKIR